MAKRKHRVVIAPEARDDLRKELNYLRRKRGDAVARKVNKGLQKSIKSLDTFPEKHRVVEQISSSKRKYRLLPKWSYLIIYRVEKVLKQVRIVSIFSSSRDPEEIDKIKGR